MVLTNFGERTILTEGLSSTYRVYAYSNTPILSKDMVLSDFTLVTEVDPDFIEITTPTIETVGGVTSATFAQIEFSVTNNFTRQGYVITKGTDLIGADELTSRSIIVGDTLQVIPKVELS